MGGGGGGGGGLVLLMSLPTNDKLDWGRAECGGGVDLVP